MALDGDLAGQRRDRGQEPRRQRVGVDGDAEPRRRRVAGQLRRRVRGEQLDLAGEPQHRLAGAGRPGRPAAHEQHLAGGGLERLEALADRRWRDVERARRRVERAVLDDGLQRAELLQVGPQSETRLMHLKNP
jgi:hypothetical protein